MSGLTVSLILSLIIGLFSVSGYSALKKGNTTLQPNYTGRRSQRTEIPQRTQRTRIPQYNVTSIKTKPSEVNLMNIPFKDWPENMQRAFHRIIPRKLDEYRRLVASKKRSIKKKPSKKIKNKTNKNKRNKTRAKAK